LAFHQNASDPCLFTGIIIDPSNPTVAISSTPLTFGVYVDNFVYFLEDPQLERRFKQLLANLVMVKFMGTVDWFLGTNFQRSSFADNVSVHMSQTSFTAHLVEDNNVHTRNITPT
jgi:hypothetical protein